MVSRERAVVRDGEVCLALLVCGEINLTGERTFAAIDATVT